MAPNSSSGSKTSPAHNYGRRSKMPTWQVVLISSIALLILVSGLMVVWVAQDWAIVSHSMAFWPLVVTGILMVIIIGIMIKLVRDDRQERAHHL